MTHSAHPNLTKSRLYAAVLAMAAMPLLGVQSIGTSDVTTLIARRSQYHQSVLVEYMRSPRFSAAVTTLATRMTHVGLSANYAQRQALARMYAMLLRQAQAISYFEVY